jgi:hypothetical protein
MHTTDRRTLHRRGAALSTNVNLGATLTDERREKSDRRKAPRRRADMRTIVDFARSIHAGETRLEVIVDGSDGMRLVAMFACGCSATEPVGAGKPSVAIETCAEHTAPPVARERRKT